MIAGGGLLNANASFGLAKSGIGSAFGKVSGAVGGAGRAFGLNGLMD